MKYLPKEFSTLVQNQRQLVKTENGRTFTVWEPARPYCSASLWTRCKHAFWVAVGVYDVIDWGDQ